MLRVTHSFIDGVHWLRLEGRLAGPWVEELRAACASVAGGTPALDLDAVDFADAAGVAFLAPLARRGHVRRCSGFVRALLDARPAHLAAARPEPDAAAIAAVVRAHGGALLALARGFLRDDAQAIDVIGQVVRTTASDAASLRRAVASACLARLRSLPHDETVASLLPVFDADGHHAVAVAPPMPRAGTQEERAAVRQRIDDLPTLHRAMLLACDVVGLSAAEVAQTLGVPRTLVEQRLHRARQALTTLLQVAECA
jgi:RNA polymerase sigma-70 factor (ECF subfamily)